MVQNDHIGPPFYLVVFKTNTLEIKGSLFKMFNLWRIESISPLISHLIRGAPRAGSRLKPIPASLCSEEHTVGDRLCPLSSLQAHGIPILPLSEPDTKSTPPSSFHETKFSPNQNLSFPTAGSLISGLSVFRITPIPLSWHCCLYSYPAPHLLPQSSPFFIQWAPILNCKSHRVFPLPLIRGFPVPPGKANPFRSFMWAPSIWP